MSIIERQQHETPADFAQRMIELVNVIAGRVECEAGLHYDFDDVISDARFIVEQSGSPDWSECWQLQLEIQRVISRMTSPTRLHRVLFFAQEMAR